MPNLKSKYTIDIAGETGIGSWIFRKGQWPMVKLPQVVMQYWDAVIEEPAKPKGFND